MRQLAVGECVEAEKKFYFFRRRELQGAAEVPRRGRFAAVFGVSEGAGNGKSVFLADCLRDRPKRTLRDPTYYISPIVSSGTNPSVLDGNNLTHFCTESSKNVSSYFRPRHQGKAIKKLGIEARKDIEEFTGKRCFLSLHIKVLKDWRNSDRALKSFGYALED